MPECASYETPLWTLVGVVIGFVLSYVYNLVLQRKQYKARVQEVIERIKKITHLPDAKQAIRRLADFLPQFKEKERIEILLWVGMESVLNAYSEEVTDYVIEEFRWIILVYEAVTNSEHQIKRSRQDRFTVESIQCALWDIASDIVEYRQSKKLLNKVFALLDILDKYSIIQKYERPIILSMQLYEDTGLKSVGIEYGKSGFKTLNFKFGINQSIKQLNFLKEYLKNSSVKISRISTFSQRIDDSIIAIKRKYEDKINEKSSNA
jgi:hypothetical protein